MRFYVESSKELARALGMAGGSQTIKHIALRIRMRGGGEALLDPEYVDEAAPGNISILCRPLDAGNLEGLVVSAAKADPPGAAGPAPGMAGGSGSLPWPDPTPAMLRSPEFDAVWKAIKGWDIRVPAHGSYSGATGNHVRAILDALANTPASPSRGPEPNRAETGSTEGGSTADEITTSYRLRSAMDRLEVALSLVEEAAMRVAMIDGASRPDIDLRGRLRQPSDTPWERPRGGR